MLAKVLALLEQWGLPTGVTKLKEEIAATTDAARRAALEPLLDQLLSEESETDRSAGPQEGADDLAILQCWARAGQAHTAMHAIQYQRAHALLDQAKPPEASAHRALRATLAHYRGAVLLHEDRVDAALPYLHDALELFGEGHFAIGRVLDTLGMLYAGKDNFTTAREFFQQAIVFKQRFQDDLGVALSHGQLGRLALDWGNPTEAEEHFRADLKIALAHDPFGAALMYDHLGQAALAQERWPEAGAFLDESIRRGRQGAWTKVEGFARKDRALVHLALGELDQAQEQLQQAEQLFQAAAFKEGLAHVNRTRAKLLLALSQYDQAEQALWAALAHFEKAHARAEVARAQWEMARVLRARGAAGPLVADALLQALDSAEGCRRHVLVRNIEAELRQVDEAAYCRHIYHRARGRGIHEDTVSLLLGDRDTETVLFLDLQGSTEFVRGTDPEIVMVTLNQMMADLAGVLQRHGVHVTAYLGDGFMALIRGGNHARRGVTAALDLTAALREFNRPRAVLTQPLLHARLGLSTGEVFVGNVGTYDKMDFTALGATVNLAARLQTEAEPGQPCISHETHEHVADHFVFREGNPRSVKLKGIGQRQVWDVVGPK